MVASSVLFAREGHAPRGLDGLPSLISRSLEGFAGDPIDAMDRMRMDSDTRLGEALAKEHGIRVDAAELARLGIRADSASTARGLYLARQLEHRYADVLREPERALNGFDLIPQDTSVPPGVKEHTVSRLYLVGDAVIYRGGNQGIPRIALSQEEEQYKVKHIADSFGLTLFERQSASFANFAHEAELLRGARTIAMRYANRLIWDGSSVHKILGVLTYPWLPKRLIATPFDGTADPDDVLGALNRLANYPSRTSDGTMRPDTVCWTEAVHNYLSNTRLGSFSDRTILEHWFATNSLGIKKADIVWELRAKGPGSTDGILFYRKHKDSIANVLVQPFTTTPVQHSVMEDVTYCYMSIGGIIMRDVGNNILGWVTVAAA